MSNSRERPVTTGSPDVDALIEEVLARYPGSPNADLVEEMIVFTLRLITDATGRGEVKLLRAALKELRHAFRVFAPYHGVRKVTIFGSARVPPEDPCYALAREFARVMAERGWMTITGAGPGIMAAGNEGAGRENTFGVNILLDRKSVV